MTVEEFRRLLFAPEIIVLVVADAALRALERAVILEHPLVRDPASGGARAPSCATPPDSNSPCDATDATFASSSARPTSNTTRFDVCARPLNLLDPRTLNLRDAAQSRA